MYQLKITRPGSLLSVLVDREITPAQLSIITALLKVEDPLSYGEVLAFLATRKRLLPEGGIEQYQSESR